ncbi:MAG TPA: hypothetical protein VNW72_10315 [Chthoniobacterales bacterium]|nr:hypothetical protein [Chthoniobacterales bacterium]
MKTKNVRRSAFVMLRALIASLLCLTAVMLALFASAQLSHLGQRSATGAIKLDKYPAEPPSAKSQRSKVVKYTGAPQLLTPVTPVRTAKLRDMAPIDPEKVEKHWHPEPMRPKLLKKSGRSAKTAAATAVQTKVGAQVSAPTPTGVSFEGVGVGLGAFSPCCNPPDTNGRVGATQYVQWNNTSFAVFNKNTGALEYGPAAGNTLFQSLGGVCASHNDGDPVVSYDILAGRWVISQFAVAGGDTSYSHQCIAVSTTEDATGEWYVYDFETDMTNFIDYPKTGVWPDGYYMSAHVYSVVPTDVGPGLPVAPPNAFIQGRIYVFERQAMINGLAARMQSQDLGAEFGFLPADLDSLTPPPAGEAEFLIGPNFALTNLTDSFRVAITWDPAPTMVVTPGTAIQQGIGSAPCVSNTNGRDCVPEPSPAVGTDYLDNLAGHYMYRLAYRNQGTQALADESLVVSAPDAGSDANHGAVTWFEFRNNGSSTATPTVFQSGTFDPDTAYRWMPSIAMDKDRNIALGYSKASTTIKPGSYVTGRLATDSAGTMGAETQMQAGLGVQQGGGNRWGDYSSMTIDPIDQCTFYYTNEYLKTDGAFNWSTLITSYKFPSCASAANLYGTVTGTITSAQTGAPIAGVRVGLSNGYANASDVNGVYTILVPAGTYTATAADAERDCASASPASAVVAPPGGGTATQNFLMTGTSKLEANGFTIDDSLGNNNGIVNRAECVKVNLGIKNNGCAKETAISAQLTTTTPGVTVTDANSTYSDKEINESGTNLTPFKISVSNSFSCGTPIALSLNLTYAGGSKSIAFTVPTCAGGPDQTIPSSSITTSDASQPDRLGRNGVQSPCSGKACPGAINSAGTRNYKTFTFTNTAGAPRCYTVTINAATGVANTGDIESAAYQTTYTPPTAMGDASGNMCMNYLGDSGISGLGTTVGSASYSFTVAANSNFVIVVNTTAGSTNSSTFSGTVSGFIDNTPGPGDCATIPPELTSVVSRKTHGNGAGTFDVPLPLPPNGIGIECRTGGATGDHTVVATFALPVTVAGNGTVKAQVTSGTGQVGSGGTANGNAVTVNGAVVTIPLTNVANAQRLGITLYGVSDGTHNGNVVMPMAVLLGDTTGNGVVNSSDISQTQSQSGQPATSSNFREDVTVNGLINSSDISLVQSKSGTALP